MYRLGCASLCVPFLCVFLREIFSQERTCCVHMAAKSKRVTASTEQPRFKLKRHDIDDEYRWLCDSLYSGHRIVERRMTQSLISLSRAFANCQSRLYPWLRRRLGWVKPNVCWVFSAFCGCEFSLYSEIFLSLSLSLSLFLSLSMRDTPQILWALRDRRRTARRILGEIRRISAVLEFKKLH